MKIAILLTVVCLLAGANAQTDILGNLGTALKETLNHVKDNGKNVLTGLLEQGKQAGGQLLQSALLKLLEGLGTQTGKRDLQSLQMAGEKLAKLKASIEAKLAERKSKVGAVVDKAMEKLKAVLEKLGGLSFLKKPLAETNKEIDEATAHYVTVHRRFLLDTLKEVGNQLAEQLKTTVTDLGQTALQKLLETALTGAAGKRELHPAIKGIVDFLTPHVKTIVDSVNNLGTTLKGHAGNLLSTVQQHAGQLSTKLQGHANELKQHGQTLLGHGQKAVDALKAAVTDILNQTLNNAKGTITDATKTLGSAGETVSNHVIDALKGAGSQ